MWCVYAIHKFDFVMQHFYRGHGQVFYLFTYSLDCIFDIKLRIIVKCFSKNPWFVRKTYQSCYGYFQQQAILWDSFRPCQEIWLTDVKWVMKHANCVGVRRYADVLCQYGGAAEWLHNSITFAHQVARLHRILTTAHQV